MILLRFVVLSRAGGYLLSVTYNTVTDLKTISILSEHFAVQKKNNIRYILKVNHLKKVSLVSDGDKCFCFVPVALKTSNANRFMICLISALF